MAENLSSRQVKLKSPLLLAYVGDGVYELKVRSYIVDNIDTTPNNLHRLTISFVSAKAQHQALLKIKDMLTEEEQNIVRRGKNSSKSGIPRNSCPRDYRAATGFEALFGYLYLLEQKDRIDELFEIIVKSIELTID